MKIIQVNPFFYPYAGGTENYIHDLSKRLAKKHEVHVICARFPGERHEEEINGIHVHRVPSIVLKRLPPPLPPPFAVPIGFEKQFVQLCKKTNPDIIHLHNRFFPSFNKVAVLKTVLKKPLFLSLHNARPVGINLSTDILGGFYDGVFGRAVMRSADHVIANSKYTLEVTLPRDCWERGEVIYNGIDTKLYKREKTLKKTSEEFTAISVCRLLPQKGLEYLVRAVPKTREKMRLKIIGDGPEKKRLARLAEKLGVRNRIEFLGKITDNELRKQYANADAFILPSLWEPFGIVLLEAMAFEVPVISTRVGGIPEVVGDAGLLAAPKNPGQLASRIDELANNAGLRKKLAAKARKRAESVFDWDIIARKVEKSYENFLRGWEK